MPPTLADTARRAPRPASERRSGVDRRRADKGPPAGKRERRVGMEPRSPEVREVEPTPSEWAALVDGDKPGK